MILDELRKVSSGLQGRCAPVPWGILGMGELGYMTRERGLYINPAYASSLDAALRDADKYERVSREVSNGRLGGDVVVPIAQRISDRADIVHTIKRMRGALTSWDNIVTAQTTGKASIVPIYRTAVISAPSWELDFVRGPTPAAGSFANIPGGSSFDGTSTGSIISSANCPIGASDHCYLNNLEISSATVFGPYQILGVIDLLVGAGNIAANTTTSQSILTTSLPRWTTGEGLCMSLVVTTALVGGTAPTITISYTDQGGGTANSTGAIAITTGAAAARILPVQDGPMIRLASGDYGVRQIEACILGGTLAMTSGVMAAFIYKPIMFIGSIQGLTTARTTPAQAGWMKRITDSAGQLPCLSNIRLASGTTGSAIQGLLEFAWG